MRLHFYYLIPLCFLNFHSLALAEDIRLRPIVSEGAYREMAPREWVADSLIQSTEWKNLDQSVTSTGDVSRSLQKEESVSVLSYGGKGGSLSSAQGSGRSAEETEVRIYGISLNPAQGGGFDLSTFPSFVWSGYRYLSGATEREWRSARHQWVIDLGALTFEAIARKEYGVRATQWLSDEGNSQTSVGVWIPQKFAALVGVSSGKVRGPTLNLSGMSSLGERVKLRAHLLGTRLDSPSEGSLSYPTPRARQITSRWIPVLQSEYVLGAQDRWMLSGFWDGLFVNYDDPVSRTMTRDRTRQWGADSAWISGRWKTSLSGKKVDYRSLSVPLVEEWSGNGSVTHDWDWSAVLMQASVGASGVSGVGAAPEFTLGARHEPSLWGVYSQVGYASKFPSLVNRYYQMPGVFAGNVSLRPEDVAHGLAGVEGKSSDSERALRAGAEVRLEKRWSAQVNVTQSSGVGTVVNRGEGHLAQFKQKLSQRVFKNWEWRNQVTLTSSRVDAFGRAFPYLPDAVDVASLQWDEGRDQSRWNLVGSGRFVSGALSSATTGARIEGYNVFDLGAGYRPWRGFDLQAELENVFDRTYQVINDYRMPGRTVVVQMRVEL